MITKLYSLLWADVKIVLFICVHLLSALAEMLLFSQLLLPKLLAHVPGQTGHILLQLCQNPPQAKRQRLSFLPTEYRISRNPQSKVPATLPKYTSLRLG